MNKISTNSLQLVCQMRHWSASQKTILGAPYLSNVSKYLILTAKYQAANQNSGKKVRNFSQTQQMLCSLERLRRIYC
jgi:hypothetical protein